MPRSRDIRPEFFTDEKVGDLAYGARLLFVAMWCHSDLRGVFEHNPKQLRVLAFPFDEGLASTTVAGWMTELEAKGMIVRFEAAGKTWGHVQNWVKHQTASLREVEIGTDRPAPPEWIDPPQWAEIERRAITSGRRRVRGTNTGLVQNQPGTVPESTQNGSRTVPEQFQNHTPSPSPAPSPSPIEESASAAAAPVNGRLMRETTVKAGKEPQKPFSTVEEKSVKTGNPRPQEQPQESDADIFATVLRPAPVPRAKDWNYWRQTHPRIFVGRSDEDGRLDDWRNLFDRAGAEIMTAMYAGCLPGITPPKGIGYAAAVRWIDANTTEAR